jgi:hypothetical protein
LGLKTKIIEKKALFKKKRREWMHRLNIKNDVDKLDLISNVGSNNK